MARRTLADKVFEMRILPKLTSGVWLPGSSVPPTRELATEFAVSLTTVQAALRKAASRDLLSCHARQRAVVLPDAAAQARRSLARLAARSRSQRLAVLFPDSFRSGLKANRPYAQLVEQVVRTASRHGMSVRVVTWPLLDQVAVAAALARQGYSAAFALGFDREYVTSLYLLRQQQFPVVTFNRRYTWFDTPSVRIDDYGAAQRLGRHLVSLGHRNMCMVVHGKALGSWDAQHATGRVTGWLDFLHEQGLYDGCLMPLHVCDLLDEVVTYSRVFERIMGEPDRPTAIVFSHDQWARQFLADPRFARFRSPAELSLAIFEPVDAGAWGTPLTSLRLNLQRISECVVEMIEKMLAGDLNPSSIRVPMEFCLTDSVGPPPRSGAAGCQPVLGPC